MENIYLNDEYSVELIKNLKKYHLDDNVMILTAMKFAKKYHDGKKRKYGETYYMHPVNVAILVLEFTQFPEPICAALLHDTLGSVVMRF